MTALDSEALESRIAIVGMAGRFPGAPDIETYWRNLLDGVESTSFFEADALRDLPAHLRDHPDFVPAFGAIERIEWFDPVLFGLNPAEAASMDPQHRLFLACCWRALEQAGIDPDRAPGPIGVYGGASANSYLRRNLLPRVGELDEMQVMVGNQSDFLATRVAYQLGLIGAAVNVQSACSTSLLAVHLAVQALLSGECDVALAGGASVRVPQVGGHVYREGLIFSPDGRCRPFDAAAKGTFGGSGVGVVALMRLEDALADRHPVIAVVAGSAANNDGAARAGFTAPGVSGQAAVLKEALGVAGLEPGDVGYVEAHGTATPLGDPIEVQALNQVYGELPRQTIGLGSVKSNFGHLDAAAGVASFVKVALAVSRGEVPPTLHFQSANPAVPFADGPFTVQAERMRWDAPDRVAGVSAFGIGGTNVHALVEQPPAAEPVDPSARTHHPILLAAHLTDALDRYGEAVADGLGALDDSAFTLAVGRRALPARRACVAATRDEAVQRLRDGAGWTHHTRQRPTVVFQFPGQGAQRAGMAALRATEPVFAETLDACIAAAGSFDLAAALRADTLTRTDLLQPALFAVSLATARLLRSWGIVPDVVVGHSVGSYAAACDAGVFGLADGLRLVIERGRLMQAMPPGAMLAVALPPAELRPLLTDGLALAAVNAPDQCVVSGPAAAVDALAARLSVPTKRLDTSHAFHHPSLEPVLAPFRQAVARCRLRAPTTRMIADGDGTWLDAARATDPGWWADQLTAPVRYDAALARAATLPAPLLVEVGPGRTLTQLTRRSGLSDEVRACATRVERPDGPVTAACRAWVSGVDVDWSAFYGDEERRRVPLPGVPHLERRCWLPAPVHASAQRTDGRATWLPTWRRDARRPTPGAPGRWTVLPHAHADALAAELREAGHSVAVGGPAGDEDHLVSLDGWTGGEAFDGTAGLQQVLGLAHWLARRSRPVRVWFVADDLHRVLGDEPVDPQKALAFGAVRTLQKELPEVTTASLDVPADADPSALVPLLTDNGMPAATAALRHGHRWLPSLQAASLPADPDFPDVVLISGGLGGIGLTLAQHLAEVHKVRVVLFGRSAEEGTTPVGGDVHVLRADVTSADDVARVVAHTRATVGEPGLVLHCAGVPGGSLLATTTPEALADGIAAKVTGTARLLAALPDTPTVLFSSVAALLGPAGQLGYAAACAHQDAVAAAHDHVVSIDWARWNQIGMARTAAQLDDRPLGPAEAIAAFEQVWRAGHANVAVYPGDLPGLVAARTADTAADLLARMRSATTETRQPRPSVTTAFVEPRDAEERSIAALWQGLLGLDRVGADDDFFELGGHSLLATQLLSRIRETFDVTLPIADAFEFSTVAGLAARVRDLRDAPPPPTTETPT